MHRRPLLVAVLAAGGGLLAWWALLAWWLFGSSVSTEAGTSVTMHRFLGRVTRIDVVRRNGARTCREQYRYTWSEPYVEGGGCMTMCPLAPASWHDYNCDGRADTWMYRRAYSDDGDCHVEYRLDTDGDGKPDWTFVKRLGEYQATAQEIKARRGY